MMQQAEIVPMQSDAGARVVVATLKVGRSASTVLGVVIVTVFFWWFAISKFDVFWQELVSINIRAIALFAVLCLSPLFLFSFLGVLIRLLSRERAALWVTEDSVVYLSSWHLSVKRELIAGVHLSKVWFDWNLVITLTNGRTKQVGLGLMREPSALICSRLEAVLTATAFE